MFFLSKQDHSPNIVLICEKEEANPLTTPPSIQGLQFNHPKAIASFFLNSRVGLEPNSTGLAKPIQTFIPTSISSSNNQHI